MIPAATFSGRPVEPQSPILKGKRFVLYDRETVWGPHKSTMFFVDCFKTGDGKPKDKTYTNMHQCGCLGTPLELDVAYISVYPLAGDDEYLAAYDRFSKSQANFSFITGAQTVFDSRPMALMTVREIADRAYRDRITNKMNTVSIEDGKLVVHEMKPPKDFALDALFADRGCPRSIKATTPDHRARRLNSTESFSAHIANPRPDPNEREIDVYVCLEGVLYSP